MHLRKRYIFPLAIVLLGALALGSAATAATPPVVVASGFESPRGVAFIGNRAVVSESGSGGSECIPAPAPFNQICVGPTSQVSWVDTNTGAHTLLAGGFYSSFSVGTGEALGLSGLAVQGRTLYAQISTTSRELGTLANTPLGQEAGDLIEINTNTGAWKTVANVGDSDFDYTAKFPPKTLQEHDANPTGLLQSRGSTYVADSGANTITQVSGSGETSVIAYFGQRYDGFPTDEVPTCLASAGDDGLWLGTLSGNLWRVKNGVPTPIAVNNSQGTSLLSHVTGCTVGRDGTLYLVNMFGPGAPFTAPPASSFFIGSVVAFHPNSGTASVLADTTTVPQLFEPYGVTIGPDGNLYVTAGATCPASGQGPLGCTVGSAIGGRLIKISL